MDAEVPDNGADYIIAKVFLHSDLAGEGLDFSQIDCLEFAFSLGGDCSKAIWLNK